MRYPLLALAVVLAGCATSSPRSSAPTSYAEATVVQTSARAAPEASLDRRVVQTASVRLTVGDGEAAPTVQAAADVATALGGYVAVQTSRSATLRVPSARLGDLLTTLDAAGEVTQREIRAVDVTDEAIDLQARLDNAVLTRDRLRALLDRAESVADVLTVERELAAASEQVERLTAQAEGLQNRVALATVSLWVSERPKLGPVSVVASTLFKGVRWLFVRG